MLGPTFLEGVIYRWSWLRIISFVLQRKRNPFADRKPSAPTQMILVGDGGWGRICWNHREHKGNIKECNENRFALGGLTENSWEEGQIKRWPPTNPLSPHLGFILDAYSSSSIAFIVRVGRLASAQWAGPPVGEGYYDGTMTPAH